MFKLLSKRIKDSNGEPEIYIYDKLPNEFRTQVYYIINDVVDPYCDDYHKCLWNNIHDYFAREKGIKKLGYNDKNTLKYGKSNIEEYLNNSSDTDTLDFVDYTFNMFDVGLRNIKPNNLPFYNSSEKIDNAIKELNFRFKQHMLGYEFINGEIIRIDNTIIHNNIIKPALKLIYDEDFSGAEDEIMRAFEYMRNADNKNAILEAAKAFESTIKIICDKKGYVYDKYKDTAQKLINILKDNNFYPSYMTEHLTNLSKILETGLPVLRNKNSGHGQGSSVVNIPNEFAEYALNLAASNIVFLVRIYNITK